MTPVCPVCDSADVTTVAAYRHHHPTFAGLSRVQCNGCGMGFVAPIPDDAALRAYNAHYFDTAHGGRATDPVATAFHAGINRLRATHIERYAARHGVPVDAVLEIGPGGGYLARHWLAQHPSTKYHAIESDVTCHPQLRAVGVTLHGGESNASLPAVDLVILSHVLEHVPNPAAFLAAVTHPLRQGGILFIEVPCLDWRHKNEDEPHLLFFDKAPLRRLVGERLGFTSIEVSYHGRDIEALRLERGRFGRVRDGIRRRLLAKGITWPFARSSAGMEPLESPLERAAIRPFEAHREHSAPSWWLRAVCIKS